jgi:hypothetical protein
MVRSVRRKRVEKAGGRIEEKSEIEKMTGGCERRKFGVLNFFGKEISRSEVKGVVSLFFRCY